MSLGLVAYGSSDESDSNEEEVIEEKQKETTLEVEKAQPQSHSTDSDTVSEAIPLLPKSASPNSQTRPSPVQTATTTDSGISDSIANAPATVSSSTSDPHISDEDDDFMLGQSSDSQNTFGLRLPPPKASATEQDGGFTGDVKSAEGTSFMKMPAPRNDDSTGNSSILGLPKPTVAPPTTIEDDTLEDMVKPKAAELELAAKLKPPGKKKSRQPVKITIPELPDADSDEEKPASKKLRPSGTKSGLFSLLPAPKHATVKETNRKLIPHTLTRKPASSSAAAKPAPGKLPGQAGNAARGLTTSAKAATTSTLPGIQDEDSDEDDGEGNSSSNFFSLGGDGGAAALSASSFTATSSLSTLPPVSVHRVTDLDTQTGTSASSLIASQDSTISSSDPSSSASSKQQVDSPHAETSNMELADAPLQFKSTYNPAAPPVGAWGGHQGYSHHSEGQDYGAQSQAYFTNQQYNYANVGEQSYPEMPPEDVQQVEELGPDGQEMDMEQLLRLQGRRRSGREEINIIDVNADDHVSQVDLTKTLTEETDMMSHSKKKNKDMPSGQQKRKHQITYLAFKAKEREIALKNQWSENRSARKHTQAKYGF